MWSAYDNLQKMDFSEIHEAKDVELDAKINTLLDEFDIFMDDDLNTAKVLANMFELVPTINSLKDGKIEKENISSTTLLKMQQKMKIFVEDVFGLQSLQERDDSKLYGAIDLLIDIRKQAKSNKDYVTSDKIRDELAAIGILLKDGKNGKMNYDID